MKIDDRIVTPVGFSEFEKRIPRSEIDNYKNLCEQSFALYDPKIVFQICGSYRRGKESSFDIDLLLCHPGMSICHASLPSRYVNMSCFSAIQV